MASPRDHVKEYRRIKFFIGDKENRRAELVLSDLHNAVKNLSGELYAKDVHFLMELIQNAEDNEYSEGVDPSLEFVITSKDITGAGAPATLLIFNNEVGFAPKNIESICSVGSSTKKGDRKRGYIGEKGIGFKSVFLITARPHIFSKGYQIRFDEDPCRHCNVGYIVPEWVDSTPDMSDIQQIYTSPGSSSLLPTTVLILPLKPDKVNPVKRQLSAIHPQVLLFLSKIKRLSFREHEGNGRATGIAITKETELKQCKSIDAEAFTLHLSADGDGVGLPECSYYMWRQRFPVPRECSVDKRAGVEEWTITLAFPNREGLEMGRNSPGIYAFLPTEMVTNFPFIIQADFLLASSRETILLDQKWNQGILGRVPCAFINAFKSQVEAHRDAPAGILPDLFRFLPVEASSYPELNAVRDSIKSRLAEEEVVPSESLVKQKFFHKPREVGRLMPSFWRILERARAENVKLTGLSSHGKYVLSSYFDTEEFDRVLEFLQVREMDDEWYVKCIQGCNLVEKVSDDVYLEILLFVAENWPSKFRYANGIRSIPLIKYQDLHGDVSFLSIDSCVNRSTECTVYLSRHFEQVPWLLGWNREFATNYFFMPKTTHEAMNSFSRKETLLRWLRNEAKVGSLDVGEFASLLSSSMRRERKLVVSYAHFLFHSSEMKFLSEAQVHELCRAMPLVDNYGSIGPRRNGVLVPANGSKWAELVLSNLWREENFIELSEDYLAPASFRLAGKLVTPENGILTFLGKHANVEDIPSVDLPDSRIPALSSSLTKENAFMLLEWIQYQKYNRGNIPGKFAASVKEGNWLQVTLNGCRGTRPPRESFLLSESSSWGNLLQNKSVVVDIPLVDQRFYGDEIWGFKDELKEVGVMTEYSEACKFIGDRLMSLAKSYSLTRTNALSILEFIKFLRAKCLPPDDFIKSIKKEKWLRTSRGDKSPTESVLLSEEWKAMSRISDIPFIDSEYYGYRLGEFERELELLGVTVGFSVEASTHLVVDNLKPSSGLASLPPDAFLLALTFSNRSLSDKIETALRGAMCVKTKIGYKSPKECILCDPDWGCLFEVFPGMPLIDPEFYDKVIVCYRTELKRIGVMVDFDEAAKAFARCFAYQASNRSVSKDNVVSLLECYRKLKSSTSKFPAQLKECFYEFKWLRTRHCDYYRAPKECVLFSSEWKSIAPVARIPFVDDGDGCYGNEIHDYKKELKSMGVVVDFKDGVKFVADGLYFRDVALITRENALSLLECIRILREDRSYKLPEEFSRKISQPWLRTTESRCYKSPSECALFDPSFAKYLQASDGPFLDEEFYGAGLSSYREELRSIGVIVDSEKGCSLVAKQLDSHSEFSAIVRVYNYLAEFKWEPENDSEMKIWKPNGNHRGEWVRPEGCVVSDKSELFDSRLIVLDKYYGDNLHFFSTAFGVKASPSTEDYCELWKSWESSGRVLSRDECCKFFGFIANHWTSKSDKTLPDEFTKMPVRSGGANGEIALVDKKDVFVADDLQLKDLFEKKSSRSLFAWYPQPSLLSLSRTKLLRVFQAIGVRKISESVQREEVSVSNSDEEQVVVPSHDHVKPGLAKLILGFLASPAVGMEAKERHKAVRDLLDLTVVKTAEPINVSYSLRLSCGESLNVNAGRTVRWERESSKLFVQKTDGSAARGGGQGKLIERATYFSEAITNGVLWESEDHIDELSELIKMGFVLGFDDAAVAFLMKSKNLEVFVEDETLLSESFPISS